MIGNVYLRDLPSEDSNRTSLVAPLGTPVEIIAQYGEWYKVRIILPNEEGAEIAGWLLTRWVTVTKTLPPAIITPTITPTGRP
jgi:SH3-like domain-containing protein